MTVEKFFELLLEELKQNTALRGYYRFLNNLSSFEFRKAYYCQRLEYIRRYAGNPGDVIWDMGCGYGTTALFLVLNGYRVRGSTLEYYYNEIPGRIDYWSKVGDVSGFSFDYENIYDASFVPSSFDAVIAQDTLHHTEPIGDMLEIVLNALRPGGKMIAVEENGNNVIQNLRLFFRRGNRRIIEIEDERLGKKILLGNENIRSFSEWKKLCERAGFTIPQESLQYVRLFPPFFYGKKDNDLYERDQRIWKKNALLRERLFFGLNF
ncbi:MAG: class I SAM-dependent methyltransferase, partial [Crocinitomicaceae bacterium]|nr:class I SAM-dependent methyltransferase [Crocinitomicaceae bacterium]